MVSDEDDSERDVSKRERGAGKVKKRKNSVGWGGGLYKVVKIRETGFDIAI